METKNVIKKKINEVAGISFEVRKWAQIIETYVKDYISKEREKLTPQKPKVEPKSYKSSWSYNDSEYSEFGTDYTHFESNGGNVYDSAKVYGYELYIDSKIAEDHPNITKDIQNMLFKVDLDGAGEFTVDTVGTSLPNNYLYPIFEIIHDRMVMGEVFYTDNNQKVFATIGDEVDYRYMAEAEYGRYGGYQYTPQPIIDKIEINGKNFPDAYEDFKVDKWIITSSSRIEYDHWKSGYDESGQYIVYLNMPLYSVGGSALVHEIKHAYDDWNRMSKGAPPIRAGWEIKNIYTPDFEKLVLGGSFKLSPMLHPIIRYYYLGSKLESPAYLENEYDNASMMGSYRDTAKKLINFKASNFLDKRGRPAKGLQESWDKLITEFDIPFFRKFKNVVDFLTYTEKHFNKRGRDILNRIDKMRYVHNRPQTSYQPKAYTKPKEKLTQVEIEYDKLDAEITKLEEKWDQMNKVYQESGDPKLKKELDDLNKVIFKMIDDLNYLASKDNLPF